MVIIAKRNPWTARYQFKIALTYIFIILVVLVLLNTYPVMISQQFIFQSKHSGMINSANLIASTLSGLETLSEKGVRDTMNILDDKSQSRILVIGDNGLVLFDSAVGDSVAGRYALLPEPYQALDGRDVFYSRFTDNAFDSRVAVPVTSRGHIIGCVYLHERDTEQAALLLRLQADLANISIIIASLVIVLSIMLSAALGRRLGGLLRAIRLVREGQYSHEAPVRGHDELAELAVEFNELTARLQRTEKLRRQFVSDASHELRTPLASVRLLSDSILCTPDMSLDEVREFVADIGDETDRLSRMTEKLMLLTRLDAAVPVRKEAVDLRDVTRRAVHMLTLLARRAGVTLHCELSDQPVRVLADPDDAYQMIFNLVENGIKYNHEGGKVTVFAYAKDGRCHWIVDDTGVGVPPDDLPRLFDRFYRVDKARSRKAGGAGLGLSIVRDTAHQYGGSVTIESQMGIGTRFILEFPEMDAL